MCAHLCVRACACACLGSSHSVAVQSSSWLKDRSERRGDAAQAQEEKRKEKRRKRVFSTETFHSTQKKETGDFGVFFFLKTRVGGREEHLISPQLTCAWWAWLSGVHRLCHEFPQEEQNTFCTQHPGGQMKVFKGRTGRSRQVAAFIFYHSYITVAPLGHARTRLPGTSLTSDCFSNQSFNCRWCQTTKKHLNVWPVCMNVMELRALMGHVTYFYSLVKQKIKRETKNLSFEGFQSTDFRYLFQFLWPTLPHKRHHPSHNLLIRLYDWIHQSMQLWLDRETN